jgi:ribose-phosphate pyrophosphokinase
MIDTGHTVKLAAEVLKEAGAKDIYVLICHGLLSDVTMKTLRDLPIKKLIVSVGRRMMVRGILMRPGRYPL